MGISHNVAGDAIRELRTAHNISQSTLAEALKVTPNTISRWETGTYRPSLDDVWNLSLYFRVPVSKFFPRNPAGAGYGLNEVSRVLICDACLDGVGGECHTPGCLFWIQRAPELPLRDSILMSSGKIKPLEFTEIEE